MSAYGRRHSSGDGLMAVIGVLVILGCFSYFLVSCGAAVHQQTVTIHAYGKEDGHNGKRVYTTDGDGIYSVNDAWVAGKVASGTTYAKLPVPIGAMTTNRPVALTCRVNGARIPIFSMFKNILECSPAATP